MEQNEDLYVIKIMKLNFRKYRRRIEDIIKYVLASPVDEGNDNAAVSDLTEGIIKYVLASSVDEESHDAAVSDLALNIFDPMNGNKTSDSMTTGTVSKQLKNVDEEHTGSNKFAKVCEIEIMLCLLILIIFFHFK